MSNKTNPMDVQTDFQRHNERHAAEGTEPLHNGWKKWVIIAACIVVAAAVILVPIIISENRTGQVSLPEDIAKFTIYRQGTNQTTFSYTDSAKIKALTNYFSSLKLKATTRTPNGPQEFIIGGWDIRISSNGEISGMTLMGSEYLQDPQGVWWKITEAEMAGFEELLKSQMPDEMPQNPVFEEWVS